MHVIGHPNVTPVLNTTLELVFLMEPSLIGLQAGCLHLLAC